MHVAQSLTCATLVTTGVKWFIWSTQVISGNRVVISHALPLEEHPLASNAFLTEGRLERTIYGDHE